MTTVRRDIQTFLLFTDGEFNMWHDYMNLGRVIQRLCVSREEERRDGDVPKQEPASPWNHGQVATHPREEEENEEEEEDEEEDVRQTTSSSSLSDSSSSSGTSSSKFCCFCKQNGESPRVYRTHRLRSGDGRVTCPILRNYTCPTCEASGDKAHTRRYCPQARRGSAGKMVPQSRFW